MVYFHNVEKAFWLVSYS